MNKETIVYGLDELDTVVDALYRHLDTCKIFTFEGSLGAGKTTLIRAFLKKCEIDDAITSPTFTYMNIYKNVQGKLFYHFDLYRLQDIREFYRAGFQEYLYQPDSWALIEWPGIIESIIQKGVCKVEITYKDSDKRELTITTG
jgi:tRNA threonylcarbamoyladenosine biosynthesis protein TsaE